MNSVYALKTGKQYKVKKSFTDFDGIIHQKGKTWIFEKITYLPYESGLSLFVNEKGIRKTYRFQDIDEKQANLLSNFMDYMVSIETPYP